MAGNTPTQTPLQGLSLAPEPTTAISSSGVQIPAPQFDPQKLADIHLPENISQLPAGPGWWILLALLVLIVLLSFLWKVRSNSYAYKQTQKLKQLKFQAIQELLLIKQNYKEYKTAHKVVQQMSVFLRRYALSLYPRHQVASLTDEQWLTILDTLSNTDHFSTKFSDLLLHVPYQAEQPPIDTELLSQLFHSAKALIELPHRQLPTIPMTQESSDV